MDFEQPLPDSIVASFKFPRRLVCSLTQIVDFIASAYTHGSFFSVEDDFALLLATYHTHVEE
jgi:hypothetical protein